MIIFPNGLIISKKKYKSLNTKRKRFNEEKRFVE